MIALRLSGVTKTYNPRTRKSRTAVDSLDLEVPQGVIFGFLGPNGAGKTSTIKMVLDFIKPTSGTIEIFGHPCNAPSARSQIGYLPEQPYFHRFLTPLEVVSMHASLAGVGKGEIPARAEAAIDRAGISEYAKIPLSKLSKGLTQRVGIAQAIVGEPRLLILDEPTSGLDPLGRRHTRDLLSQLKREGKTVFLSSHILSEIEDLCDVVAVMRRGELVACGPPDHIRSEAPQVTIRAQRVDESAVESLRFAGATLQAGGDYYLITASCDSVYPVMSALERSGAVISDINTERESLEEAFLRLAA